MNPGEQDNEMSYVQQNRARQRKTDETIHGKHEQYTKGEKNTVNPEVSQ